MANKEEAIYVVEISWQMGFKEMHCLLLTTPSFMNDQPLIELAKLVKNVVSKVLKCKQNPKKLPPSSFKTTFLHQNNGKTCKSRRNW